MDRDCCVYSTDLTDAQWQILEPLLAKADPTKGGRPRRFPHRQILNAIFYIEKTGCQWRMLPKEFPPWNLVWQYFRRWRDDGTLERMRLTLNRRVRKKRGKKPLPSVVIADSQSVKTALKGGSAASTEASRSRAGSGIS
jgi:putative transposase